MPDAIPDNITYRPMSELDLAASNYISKAAMESVHQSQGREPSPWTPRRATARLHLMRTDPEGSWAADVNGLIVGYAQAFVRGDIWFLSQLFVRPEVHTRGIGQELLRRAMDHGRKRGARVYAVISSTSPVAQALYMRAGMFGIAIAYRMTGPLAPLASLPEPDASRKRVVDCAGWQDQIAALDLATFGAERRQDHAWYLTGEWTAPAEETAFALVRDGELEGYGYAGAHGYIAPVVAVEPAAQLPLVRMGADWLAERKVERGEMMVLSHNTTLMSALLERGWQIGGWTFLLASAPFGRFDRYHPAGGMLL